MKQVDSFPRSVVEIADMGIKMPDGCRLSARVWMPEDSTENPVPVILEHLPYRKRDGTIERDQFSHPWMAGHGYCCIRTDMRGSGESEGYLEDEYTQQELQDACDVIAWAASQPWCNGKVGMQGISWGGFNALQVAALRPPALKAIITICSTVDRYADDIHYKGGCLLLENFGWSNTMMSYSSRPPDPQLVGENWTEIWKERIEKLPCLWSVWHSHQHRDDYWKHGSVCEDYGAIEAAVLSVGGWHDGYRNTISHLVENLSAPVKGIVGPWNHKYPHYAGPEPAIGFLQESKRWWDRWLKGIDTGVEDDPAYRAYVMDSLPPKRWYNMRPGRWIAETEWPGDAIAPLTYHLGQNRLEPSACQCGLTASSPSDCGLMSGEFFPFAFSDELPDDQSADDIRSLCFDSKETAEKLEIVGAPTITLQVSSDQPDAQLAVRLCDLRPDGTSALISLGLLNLTHHASHEHPEALVPGVEVPVVLDLDQIAYSLPAGHRLRVAISTAYWPMIWPSKSQTVVTIHSGSIVVPVRENGSGDAPRPDEWQFEQPLGAPPWRAEQMREPGYSRTLETEPDTGLVTIAIDEDAGEKRDMEHGLISGSWFKERYTIHPDNPLSARVTAQWEQTGGRDGQMWRTHMNSEMWCDETFFHYKARLVTYLNGTVFQEREFAEKAERRLV